MTSPPPNLPPGFAPRRVLGAGAVGQVVLARDQALGRDVAIKVLQAPGDRDARARLSREGAALAGLKHPSLPRVFDHGEVGGRPFLVMQFLGGPALDQPPPPEDPIERMLEVAGALDEVHAAGLVHRDVKPANIVRADDGRAVLVDFGLVRIPGAARLTATGEAMGTLAFMAPEALAGAPATPAADWFSWGASLYWLLEGAAPFGVPQLMEAIRGGSLPPPRFARLDPAGEVARTLAQLLRVDPGARPGGEAALRRALGLARPRAAGHFEGGRVRPREGPEQATLEGRGREGVGPPAREARAGRVAARSVGGAPRRLAEDPSQSAAEDPPQRLPEGPPRRLAEDPSRAPPPASVSRLRLPRRRTPTLANRRPGAGPPDRRGPAALAATSLALVAALALAQVASPTSPAGAGAPRASRALVAGDPTLEAAARPLALAGMEVVGLDPLELSVSLSRPGLVGPSPRLTGEPATRHRLRLGGAPEGPHLWLAPGPEAPPRRAAGAAEVLARALARRLHGRGVASLAADLLTRLPRGSEVPVGGAAHTRLLADLERRLLRPGADGEVWGLAPRLAQLLASPDLELSVRADLGAALARYALLDAALVAREVPVNPAWSWPRFAAPLDALVRRVEGGGEAEVPPGSLAQRHRAGAALLMPLDISDAAREVALASVGRLLATRYRVEEVLTWQVDVGPDPARRPRFGVVFRRGRSSTVLFARVNGQLVVPFVASRAVQLHRAFSEMTRSMEVGVDDLVGVFSSLERQVVHLPEGALRPGRNQVELWAEDPDPDAPTSLPSLHAVFLAPAQGAEEGEDLGP